METTTTTAPPSPEEQFVAAVDAAGLRPYGQPDDELLWEAGAVCVGAGAGVPPIDPSRITGVDDPLFDLYFSAREHGFHAFKGLTPAEFLISIGALDDSSEGRRIVLALELICRQHRVHLDEARSGNVPTMPPGVIIPSGDTYRVNVDIAPGTYETGFVEDCYWERVDDTGNIIDNNFVLGAPRVEATIAASDAAFTSQGCGVWHMVP